MYRNQTCHPCTYLHNLHTFSSNLPSSSVLLYNSNLIIPSINVPEPPSFLSTFKLTFIQTTTSTLSSTTCHRRYTIQHALSLLDQLNFSAIQTSLHILHFKTYAITTINKVSAGKLLQQLVTNTRVVIWVISLTVG